MLYAPAGGKDRGDRAHDAALRAACVALPPAQFARISGGMMTRVLDLDDHTRLPWRFHGRATGLFAGA